VNRRDRRRRQREIRDLHERFGLYQDGCSFCGDTGDEDNQWFSLGVLGRFSPTGTGFEVNQFLIVACDAHKDHPWVTHASLDEIDREAFIHAMDEEWLKREATIDQEVIELHDELDRLGLGNPPGPDQRLADEAFALLADNARTELPLILAMAIIQRAHRQYDGLVDPERDATIEFLDEVVKHYREMLQYVAVRRATES
jgi:hypothetical protein